MSNRSKVNHRLLWQYAKSFAGSLPNGRARIEYISESKWSGSQSTVDFEPTPSTERGPAEIEGVGARVLGSGVLPMELERSAQCGHCSDREGLRENIINQFPGLF